MVRTVIDPPEDLHRQLDEQARARGVTVGDFVRDLLERRSGLAPKDELFDEGLRFDHAPPDVSGNVDAFLDDRP